ncbi:MAG TPA: aspartate/glutamate racemase family protein [Candidatus Sulfotelmatobacter sp.]|nr:aspartate/glutamate racemase family protein [Candidatus Sulfotelmatobacter sp.]
MIVPAPSVGLMVPINNTTMERELLAWLPPGSTCRTLRIPRQKGLLTLADLPAYAARGLELVKDFREVPLDLVVYGCTAAGILAGRERDAEIVTGLSEVTGAPTISTVSAMVAWLTESGAKEVALVTPYQADVNEQLRRLLEAAGIRIRVLSTFSTRTVDELGRITAEQVAARAREAMRDDCDALFVACSQLPTRAILEGLQTEFGRPVSSSIHATAWQARRVLGLSQS